MRHLYIHVPFCARRCVYCDFAIAVRKEIPANQYLTAIFREHEHRMAVGEWDEGPLQTLYLGGGTPSLLPSEQIAALSNRFFETEGKDGSGVEVTIEANPDDVTEANATDWHACGINRVSLGAQSFDSRVLEWMHRTHVPGQAVAAVFTLREAGIESISLDLIAALPPELERDFASDLSEAIDLEPDHISVYGLTAEPRTALSRWIDRKAVFPATDETYAQNFLLAHAMLTEAGYEHYEVSNYARSGRRSHHNQSYWDGSSYAGLGPSAHGFDGLERRWNVSPWVEYESLVTATGDATEARETLSAGQTALECTYLSLRTSDGLPLDETRKFDPTLLAEAEDHGWGRREADRWHLTPPGWLRLDEFVTALTTSAEGA